MNAKDMIGTRYLRRLLVLITLALQASPSFAAPSGYKYSCAAILEAMAQSTNEEPHLIPGLYLRDPVIAALNQKWKLSMTSQFEIALTFASTSQMPPEQRKALAVDLSFNALAPHVSVANSTLWLENFIPKNESQVGALAAARALGEFSRPDSLGLFLWGDGGVGKSLLSVGAAKLAMLRNPSIRVAFVTRDSIDAIGEPRASLESLKAYDFIILDDIHNLAEARYWPYIFSPLVIWAQERGGVRIVATSNHNPETLIDGYFAAHPNAHRLQFQGRYNAMMIPLHMEGATQRPSALEIFRPSPR